MKVQHRNYIGLLALASYFFCFPMSALAASLGEDDATTETMAMSGLALLAGPFSVGMAAYNGYRILDHRPGVGSGVLGIVAGGLSLVAGFSLVSEDFTYSRLLIVAGGASILLGSVSIAIESREKPGASRESLGLYPRICCSKKCAIWGGLEFRWNF